MCKKENENIINCRSIHPGDWLYVSNWPMCVLRVEKSYFSTTEANDRIVHWGYDGDHVSAIEITEDVLFEFGFRKSKVDGYLTLEKTDLRYEISTNIFFIEQEESDARANGIDCDHIIEDVKYIHELQNEYYKMTGKELSIEYDD